MLSLNDNRTLTETGPQTPMGDLFRHFWMPALLSEELPEVDAPPKRVIILGELLLAFRDSNNRVGIVDRRCPHRGADLYFGRNEECGLRCVYHGWKFDVDGNCTDLPTAPKESRFKEKIKLLSYPTRELAGIIWVYMGPKRKKLPEIPRQEFTLLPPDHTFVSKKWQECNWAQSLEGGIDTAHLSFLHMPAPNTESATAAKKSVSGAALSDQVGDHRIRWVRDDPRPRFTVIKHPVGLLLGAARDADNEDIYWRTTQFLMPNYAYAPNAFPGETQHGQCWVPIDDESCWIFCYSWNSDRPICDDERKKLSNGFSIHAEVNEDYLPVRRLSNNYLMDRNEQRLNSYTGIRGVSEQDAAIQNSQGKIVDRSREHLGQTDVGIIEFRKLMLASAAALQKGHAPPSASLCKDYTVQCGGMVAHRDIPLEKAMMRRFGHITGYIGDRYAHKNHDE
ncbi:MAG: ring-hydroxylating oxygenase subunit alpha [Rhodospirillaceae bacterium]|nr:ring-hydroxylating oxygenase subunit alpha [Rhodospirillaceae bacterium]